MTEATLPASAPPALPAPTSPAASESARRGTRDLDRSLVRGIAWTGISKWATQALRWGCTLLIARLLTPADYGLVGYATLYMGLVALINEFGLSAAIIQQRDLTDDQISRLGGLSALLGVGFYAVTAALALPVARFFGEPQVQWVLLALGSTFVIRGLQVLPRSLMTRDLRFRQLATIDAIEAAVLALTTLVTAYLGFRYWSLVLGSIASVLVSTTIALLWRRHRLTFPRDLDSIRGAVRFGWHIVVGRVAWYIYSNADFAVVGRVLDKAALGVYTIGWNLANIPVERVSAVVGRVTSGVFASVQTDHAALRRYLLTLTEGLAIITFPVSIGLAIVSREFVLVVLGKQWEAAIVPLSLLVFYGGFRSITLLFAQVLVAIGESRRNMQFNLVAMVVLPVGFFIGARTHGTAGVATAWIIGFPLVFVPFFIRYTLKAIGMSWGAYLKALWPAVSATAIMAAAVLAVKFGVSDAALSHVAQPVARALRAIHLGKLVKHEDTIVLSVRLLLEAAAGAVTYAATMLLLHRERMQTFLKAIGRGKR